MTIHGAYEKYKDGEEDQAKENLKKGLHDFIDKLCEKDEFWIKQERDKSGIDILRQENTIGWKIAILHLSDE